MEFNSKKIEIAAHNIKASINYEPNTTKLANDLFEKFFSDKIVELTERHAQMLKELSAPDQLDMSPSDILEMILNGVRLDPHLEEEKPVIALYKGGNKKKKVKIKTGNNFVNKW